MLCMALKTILHPTVLFRTSFIYFWGGAVLLCGEGLDPTSAKSSPFLCVRLCKSRKYPHSAVSTTNPPRPFAAPPPPPNPSPRRPVLAQHGRRKEQASLERKEGPQEEDCGSFHP